LRATAFLIADFATRKRVPGIAESGNTVTDAVIEVINLKQSKIREDTGTMTTCDIGQQSCYFAIPRTFVRDGRNPQSAIV
jgi:hypothetical protein